MPHGAATRWRPESPEEAGAAAEEEGGGGGGGGDPVGTPETTIPGHEYPEEPGAGPGGQSGFPMGRMAPPMVQSRPGTFSRDDHGGAGSAAVPMPAENTKAHQSWDVRGEAVKVGPQHYPPSANGPEAGYPKDRADGGGGSSDPEAFSALSKAFMPDD